MLVDALGFEPFEAAEMVGVKPGAPRALAQGAREV